MCQREQCYYLISGWDCIKILGSHGVQVFAPPQSGMWMIKARARAMDARANHEMTGVIWLQV